MDKAAESGSLLQVFKDKPTALKFATEKRADTKKKSSASTPAIETQPESASITTTSDASTSAHVTPDKKITANDLKELFSKRMMNKIGNKIIVSYIVLPGKDTVLVTIDICREKTNNEGEFERSVSMR